jgi:hypothetical protein
MNSRLNLQFKTWQSLPALTVSGRNECRAQNVAARISAPAPCGSRGGTVAGRPGSCPDPRRRQPLKFIFTTHD